MAERDIERIVQGSFDDLKQHLETVAQQNWPELPLHVYDTTPIKEQLAGPVETRVIDGREISFNWPEGDGGSEARRLRAEAEASKIDARFPGTDPSRPPDSKITTSRLVAFDQDIRIPEMSIRHQLSEAMFGGLPVAYGAAGVFNDAGRNEVRAFTVGLDSSMCSHCGSTAAQISPLQCDKLDPQQVRLQQLTRHFTGYHEMAHVVDGHVGAAQALVQSGSILDTTGAQNTRESLADSWATLMAVRDLGSEGEAYARLWATARVHPITNSDHQTAGAIQASLDWAKTNPDKLASLTPQQLFDQARILTAGTTRTAWELGKIHDHQADLVGASSNDHEAIITASDLVRQPEQIRGRLQQAESKRIFEEPGGRVPAAVVEFDRQMLWAQEGRQQALDDLARLNPLNTPEWRAREAERAEQCVVEVDAQKLVLARAKLERLQQWEKQEQDSPPESLSEEDEPNESETPEPVESASGPKTAPRFEP